MRARLCSMLPVTTCRLSLYVTPQPALSCDVRGVGLSNVKSYQDFSLVMNKIVGAKLNQI